MTSETHVYRINAARLLLLPAVWFVFAAAMLGVALFGTAPGETAAGIGATALLTLILAPIFYFTVWRSRLELGSDGIAHHQFGYTIRSSWANLERLVTRPGSEGLYLTAPGVSSPLLRGSTRLLQIFGGAFGMRPFVGDEDALADGRYITLTPFASRLGGGPLTRDLQRWAPHLFAAKTPP